MKVKYKDLMQFNDKLVYMPNNYHIKLGILNAFAYIDVEEYDISIKDVNNGQYEEHLDEYDYGENTLVEREFEIYEIKLGE